jgi:putative copper export protein
VTSIRPRQKIGPHQRVSETPSTRLDDRKRRLAYAVVVMCVAFATLALALWLGGGVSLREFTGLEDIGALTAWGLPMSRLVVDLSAVGTVGMLLTAALLPTEDGELGQVARRSLRTAGWLGLVWSVATAAMLVFTWSDVTGLKVSELPLSQVVSGGDQSIPENSPFLICAVLALLIAAGATTLQTAKGAVALVILSGYNLLPLTTTGHAQHERIIAYALTVHVVAVTLWVGGLAGLLIHVRRSRDLLAVAVPRFSTLALLCFIAVGASGVTMAWVNVGELDKLWGTGYGWLVVCKATALATLGVFGWWHRRRTVPAVKQRRRGAFIRLAAVEVLVMAATIALAVALSRASTPNTENSGNHAAPAPSAPSAPLAPAAAGGK